MPPDNDTPPPNWTPIDTAARLSGKSDRTLRRWVASGKLAYRREAGRLFVDLSSPALVGDDNSPGGPFDSRQAARGDTDIAALRQEVARLTAEIAETRRAIADLVSERDYLRQALMMSLASNQKLIEAPARRSWRWPWEKKTED